MGVVRVRPVFLAVLSVLVGVGALAGSAQAATHQATCANFGKTLSSAGNGDTIVLTGLCTSTNASFTLPSGVSGLTIEGASTGTNGFNGTGLSGSALGGSAVNGLTLRHLTFEDYTTASAVNISETSGTATHPFVFDHDTFSHDGGQSVAFGGGLALTLAPYAGTGGTCALSAPDVSLSNSVFTHDEAYQFGGGAWLDLECPNPAIVTGSTDSNTTASITGNSFSGDTVNGTTNTYLDGGGGLAVVVGNHQPAAPIHLTQRGNRFGSDSVSDAATPFLAGGGELIEGADVNGVGDRFTNNSLGGPTSSSGWSWGAGLATFGASSCISSQGVSSQFTNLVAAGNSIGAPTGTATGADTLGAGIYAGCSATSDTAGYHLTLVNSTISGNSVDGSPSGAVAGIDGETSDSLALYNSIVVGNTGGDDLGGFGPTPLINLTALYSDVCAPGSSTTPFSGPHNICVAPRLVAAGTGNVRETSSSPTIDVGLNSLVPAGVTRDAYGRPRIVAARSAQPIVDMGAAEYLPPPPVNTTRPTIGGTRNPGSTLTCSHGAWSPPPTRYAYFWSRNGQRIRGATSASYRVRNADRGHKLTCTVIASDAGGHSKPATSKAVKIPG